MLNADDLTAMRGTATAIRADRAVSITLWRDGQEVQLQDVRLAFLNNRPIVRQSPQAEQVTITLLVKGAVDMDIQAGDTFKLDPGDAATYVIDLVRPDRSVETTAEARVLT